MTDTTRPILEIRSVSKRFDATQALNQVSLTLHPGEVHALLGENGAGKSTLIKIITGIHKPDQGEIFLAGQKLRVNSPAEAQAYGIAAIYQEPMIFPDLNVAENIFITHRNVGAVLNWGRLYRDAEAILARLDVKLDVRLPARGLTLAAQQTVEIAKALSLKVRVLVMDEPTASLSAHEVEQLFKVVRALRDQGVAILFISHRLEEVFRLADRVTIFRDGQLVITRPRSQLTPENAIREMVGRTVDEYFAQSKAKKGERLLSVNRLGRTGAFSDITFDVHRGEILGFAGLVGARRTDVGLALFGIEPADTGEVNFKGRPLTIRSSQQALRQGIAYVTEDRRQLGLTLTLPIVSNITLPTLRKYLNWLGLVKREAEIETAEHYRKRLVIRTPSVQLEAGKLSGGNQQKVVLSKWLNAEPELLILDEPTRGIDVGAKAEVHRIIHNLAEQGLGIILISSDLPEVLAMSDRILVMREGRQMGIYPRLGASQELILKAATGQMAEPTR